MAMRVLAVFAHPDDESLVAGGTLAACATAGLEVVLVTATHGEQGASVDLDPAALGAARAAELSDAAGVLGVRTVECLDYPDGELEWAQTDELEADLVRRLRYWQPTAVLTFGAEGLYWHPDHVAIHELMTASLQYVANDGFSPWIYHATWPHGRMGELVAAMAERGLPCDLWGLSAEDFGVPEAHITSVIDVRRFLAAKLQALRCHRSQLCAGQLFNAIPDDLALEFLGREYFVQTDARRQDWLSDVVAGAEIA